MSTEAMMQPNVMKMAASMMMMRQTCFLLKPIWCKKWLIEKWGWVCCVKFVFYLNEFKLKTKKVIVKCLIFYLRSQDLLYQYGYKRETLM